MPRIPRVKKTAPREERGTYVPPRGVRYRADRARINICRRYYTIVFSPRAHLATRARTLTPSALREFLKLSERRAPAFIQTVEKLSLRDSRNLHRRQSCVRRDGKRREELAIALVRLPQRCFTPPGRVSTFPISARLSSRSPLISAARFSRAGFNAGSSGCFDDSLLHRIDRAEDERAGT